MKKILTITIGLFLIIALSSCGKTPEEKAQEKAIKGGLGILYEMGKQAQDGASDQEIMNNGLDKLADLAGSITDGIDQELTQEEKDSLQQGADLFKDGGAGFKEEMSKGMNKFQEEENKRKLAEKEDALKAFGTEEQPDWAIEKGIIVPEGLTFEYRNASFKPDNYAFIMDYRVHYTAGSKEPMEEAERILKELGIKVEHIEENPFSPESVIGTGLNGDLRYQIQADDTWFTMSVMNTKWTDDIEK